jgi:hypothetical protein
MSPPPVPGDPKHHLARLDLISDATDAGKLSEYNEPTL